MDESPVAGWTTGLFFVRSRESLRFRSALVLVHKYPAKEHVAFRCGPRGRAVWDEGSSAQEFGWNCRLQCIATGVVDSGERIQAVAGNGEEECVVGFIPGDGGKHLILNEDTPQGRISEERVG